MSQSRLKRSERFERILGELRVSPTVRISELAATVGVSAETVRRDIDELSRRGLVDRTYGGAAAQALAPEPAVNERCRFRVEERTRLGVALALGQTADLRVVLCPGDYDVQEGGTFGSETAAFLRRFHATKAFIGASGLIAERPVEVNSAASWVKRTMIERSERRLLIVDHTKFEARSLEVVCPLDHLDELVTDAPPPSALSDALSAAGVSVHVARAPAPR